MRLIIFFLFTSIIFTQETIVGDTLTIMSTRLKQKVSESGHQITIITADEIKQSTAKNIDELLRFIPGIEAQSRGPFGTQTDFSMRGSTFSQVLILMDGIRFNDPLTGHFNSYIPISISEVERIEVIKGPASAIFGPDAVGGVINIISKLYARQELSESNQDADISLLTGENSLISAKGSYFLQTGQFNFSFGLQVNKSDGHQLPSGLRSDFDIKTISAGITFKIDEHWQLIYKTGFDEREFNAQYYYTASTFDLSREETSANIHQVMLSRHSDNSESQLNYTHKNSSDYFLFNPLFSANSHEMDYTSIQAGHQITFNSDFRLNFGLQSDIRSLISNDRGNHKNYHTGLYALAAIGLTEKFDLMFALRGDSDDNYGFELLPQLNMSYRASNVIVRGGIARTIRSADFTERYVSTNLPAISAGRNLGNPDLNAETAISYEFGADIFAAFGFRISTTLFLRNSEDVIDYVITNQSAIQNQNNLTQGANYLYATNLGEVKTQGLELEVNYNFQLFDHSSVDLLTGYVFTDTEIGNGLVSKYISNHAKHLITSQIKWSYKKVKLVADGLWKVRRSGEFATAIGQHLNKSYAIWNIATAYQFVDQFTAKLQINNLFDKSYADILGAQMPGRWVMIGIEWQL